MKTITAAICLLFAAETLTANAKTGKPFNLETLCGWVEIVSCCEDADWCVEETPFFQDLDVEFTDAPLFCSKPGRWHLEKSCVDFKIHFCRFPDFTIKIVGPRPESIGEY